MIYKIGNIEIDSDKYKEQFKKRYSLPFVKEIIDISGCTLLEAKQFIDMVIEKELLEVDPTALEMQYYCMAEYEDDNE